MASTNWIQLLKQAAKEERQNARISDFFYGIIEEVAPLQVRIDQKFVLSDSFLVIPKHLTDFELEIQISGKERETGIWYNALKEGDKVVLLRKEGGQKYLILDRI